MSVDMDLLLLPDTILTIIWDYCDAKEIMALSSTCHTFKIYMEKWMLALDSKTSLPSHERDCGIPIFFPNHCHSVFFTCRLVLFLDSDQDHRVFVVSRERHSNAAFDTVVWEKTKPSETKSLFYDISFRNDSSQEYCLRHECPQRVKYLYCDIRLRKQFMTRVVTQTMKEALTACLNMGSIRKIFWYPMESPYLIESAVMPFFMKLFVVSLDGMSEASSPVSRFFESGFEPRKSWIQRQIRNLFEQTLEQKEPMYCVKMPLLSTEETASRQLGGTLSHQRSESGERRVIICWFPRLFLKKGFERKQGKQRLFDQDEELVFIARIPLAPKTTGFICETLIHTASLKSLFVVFFQRRQSNIDNLEAPIDAEVVLGDKLFSLYHTRFKVSHEYEACFIYALSSNSERIHLDEIKVQLQIERDANNDGLRYWMEMVLGSSSVSTVYRPLFPIVLFRSCALRLLGPDKEQNASLKEAFDMAEMDSTPEGLQWIVEICNALLQDLPTDSM